MKKIISIALAVVMMLAVCVPAFAADIVMPDTTGDTVVKVREESLENQATYTVTIPAEIVFDWESETPNGSPEYTVVTQLELGKKLHLTSEKTKDMTLNDVELVFEHTAIDAEFDAVANVTNSVVATVPDWSGVPVAAYADGQITFTAEVVDA